MVNANSPNYFLKIRKFAASTLAFRSIAGMAQQPGRSTMQTNGENTIKRKQTSKVEVRSAAQNIGYFGTPIQDPFDVAVVIPTVLRPTLSRSLESVFAQDIDGNVQILIGIDHSDASRKNIKESCEYMPQNYFVTVLDMGYSTSVRYGGPHPAKDGGALRTVLSYLANSRYVAYLDDDNWWDRQHLSSLLDTVQGVDWASCLRWFVDKDSSDALCIDQWESTGVGSGYFKKRFGGWVDPNCLLIDKIKCESVLRLWSIPLKGCKKGMSADRNVFHALKSHFRHRPTGRPTCYYVMDPKDGLHPKRINWIKEATESSPQNSTPKSVRSSQTLSKLEVALKTAIQLQNAGRLNEAKAAYTNILITNPSQPIALSKLGLISHQMGEKKTAVDFFTKALKANPDHAETHNSLGIVLQELGELDQAVKNYKKALEINPNYAIAHSNLGTALKDLGQLNDAVTSYRNALTIQPNYAGAHYNLGNALRRLGKPDEAVASYRKALQIKPNYAEAHTSLGFSLQALGNPDAAIKSHNKALELKPNYALAHLNLSLALLLQGNFKDGWREYEWRWKTDHAKKPNHDFEKSLWNGTDLNGKVILLFAEQGLGDTIQFIRYIEEIAKYNCEIIVECQKPLFRLLKDLPKIAKLIVSGDPTPNFDVCAPLLSLPFILGTTTKSIPSNIPYIFSSAIDSHLDGLKAKHKKIGIVWAGSPTHNNDQNRSIPLSNFLPFASIQGIQLFSLQVGKRKDDLKNIISEADIVDTTKNITDFADTAEIIEQLDLVISVDTAVAHLAGAMGKTTWVLLPFSPDFRWMQNDECTPWYPTMKLFRQKKRGAWFEVFQEVETSLRSF